MARRVPFVLLAGSLLLAGCNPNFGLGGAPETPPNWTAPDQGNGGGNDASSGSPDLDQMIASLKQKVASDPKDAASRKQLGLLYAEAAKWDEAAKIFEEAEAIDPKDIETHVARAKVLIRRKDQGEAKKELVAAEKINANDEGLLRQWAAYYVLEDDIPAAVKARRTLLKKYPDVKDAEELEREMFYLQRFPELRKQKKLKDFFELVGTAAQAQTKADDATAVGKFQEALKILPDDPNLWAGLGASQARLGKKDDAETSLRKALSLDKDNSHARLDLARLYAAGGDTKQATATLKDWQKVDAKRAKQHDVDTLLAKLAKGESIADTGKAGGTSSGTSSATATASAGDTTKPGTPGVVRGTIDLAPALAGKVPPGARFYIFAKNSPAGGPPLAVAVEPTVPGFPYSFELSGANVMMQGMQFAGNVWITARVDADGSAGPGPGDLEGVTSGPIAVGTDGVHVTIDKMRGPDGQLVDAGGAPANGGGGGGGGGSMAMQTPPMAGGGGGGGSEGGSAGGTLTGTIDIAPAVRSKVPASATLFIFAKSNPGGGPPLAVYRQPIDGSTAFPLSFSLSQANVMMPGLTFSGPVYVTARIDVDGIAGAGPGDLEGVTQTPVPVGTQGLKLVIDTVH